MQFAFGASEVLDLCLYYVFVMLVFLLTFLAFEPHDGWVYRLMRLGKARAEVRQAHEAGAAIRARLGTTTGRHHRR